MNHRTLSEPQALARGLVKFASPVLIIAAVGVTLWVNAGDLNPPPGPVTSTMKDLDAVEPRIAINATNTPGDASSIFKITQPGSYYLTGNVTGAPGESGIRITSGQVTLDLNGFRLEGGGGSIAIRLDCVMDVVIKNGFISNWTTEAILGEDTTGLRIEKVHIRNILGDTVLVGDQVVIVDSSISNSASGFQVGSRSRVERCVVRGSSLLAISVSTGSLVVDCTLMDNADFGIIVSGAGSVVRDNVVHGTGGEGISVCCSSARNNRIEGNHVTGGGVGIRITHAGNYVAGNTVRGNTDNYNFGAGNHLNILLCEIPESIDWPANVTLAGSLTGVSGQNGITIASDDVTIDLAGHALIGVGSSLNGISVPAGRTNLTVRNGTIRDWGSKGVFAFNATNSQFKNLRASDNGGTGLHIGSGNLVTHCTVQDNASDGIRASDGSTVRNCSAYSNDADGINTGAGCTVTGNTARDNQGNGIASGSGCIVVGCTASFNTLDGITTNFACTVRNSSAFDNGDDGFSLGSGNTITACTARSNTSDGIKANDDCRIIDNTCSVNGSGGDGAGIHATGSDTRIEGNNVTDNDRGIDVDGSRNIIIRNTASANFTDYDIRAGNSFGPIVNVAGVGDISGIANSDHSWANFEY